LARAWTLADNEHTSDEKDMDDQIPKEVTEEGIQVMEEFLREWSSRGQNDGEDVVMAGDDNQDPEAQVQELKACLEQFRSRIENNRWLQSVLTSL
jgi:DNA mismatch repair protein MSH2